MKLWKVTLLDYFGNIFDTVHYTSKYEAEKHANTHNYGAHVSYAGNFKNAEPFEPFAFETEKTVYFKSYEQFKANFIK